MIPNVFVFVIVKAVEPAYGSDDRWRVVFVGTMSGESVFFTFYNWNITQELPWDSFDYNKRFFVIGFFIMSIFIFLWPS